MKIAVSSYSFTQAINDGRMTMTDVIPKAKELGYAGIEIVRMSQTGEEMRALAETLHRQSLEYGLPIIAYMVGNDFLKNGLEAAVAHLTKELEIARLLGAPAMRHDVSQGFLPDGTPANFDTVLPVLAEGCRRTAEIAASMGIRTMTENHGYFSQDSDRVKKLIEAVDHPNFGWLCDIGNFLCADETPADAVRTAAPMAVHVHAKDFHYKKPGEFVPPTGWFATRGNAHLRGAIIGHGIVDAGTCLNTIRSAGYDGWLSVEFEGIEDCLFALQEDLRVLEILLHE